MITALKRHEPLRISQGLFYAEPEEVPGDFIAGLSNLWWIPV
jgi:hypothetical protein